MRLLQVVTSRPDIKKEELTARDEFFVLACDGIWDVVSCDNVRDFVTDHLKVSLSSVTIQ